MTYETWNESDLLVFNFTPKIHKISQAPVEKTIARLENKIGAQLQPT